MSPNLQKFRVNWLVICRFRMVHNVLGAEAVSEFTDKTLFKERKRSFSPKALFEVQKRLLPLPTVGGSAYYSG